MSGISNITEFHFNKMLESVKAEQELDKVYHAIPEWVHRAYPTLSLAEKIARGFEQQQASYCDSLTQALQKQGEMRAFAIFIANKHCLNWMNEYWNFLISKDLEKAKTEEEKRVLTNMKKPV